MRRCARLHPSQAESNRAGKFFHRADWPKHPVCPGTLEPRFADRFRHAFAGLICPERWPEPTDSHAPFGSCSARGPVERSVHRQM